MKTGFIAKESAAAENGFTLIETLLAISVLSIGLFALAALQAASIKSTTSANKRSMAVLLAENQIETYKSTPYANLPTGTLVEEGTTLSSWGIFTRTTNFQPGIPIAGVTTISVAVTWSDIVFGNTASGNVTLQTIIAQPPG